jgi:hypothetical protein
MDAVKTLRVRLPGTKTGIGPSIFGQPTADNKTKFHSRVISDIHNKSLMREE